MAEQVGKAVDCLVIGGGVVGAMTLRALTQAGYCAALLEAGADLASGATRANSGIVHAGFDPEPGSLKAQCNVRGAALYPELAAALHFAYKPLPSLVAAYADAEMETVHALYRRGIDNGVTGMRVLSRDALRQEEPHIADAAVGALYAPSAIIEPWMAAIAAAENACDNGAAVYCLREVAAIDRAGDRFRVTARHGDETEVYTAAAVVAAAGARADEIHNMLAPPAFTVKGKRGQYCILDKQAGGLVRNVLFPCPSDKGKGILITPEIHGRIMIGPDSAVCTDKSDVRTTADGIAFVRETAAKYLKAPLPMSLQIRMFAGMRPATEHADFLIGPCTGVPGFFEAAGIESPGLASAPAIAERLTAAVSGYLGKPAETRVFVPERRPVPVTDGAGSNNQICRCERVTERTIVDAIHRNCGARSVKGVKMRTGAGAGGCQGGFCSARIVAILARELDVDKTEICYDGPGSQILTGRTRP